MIFIAIPLLLLSACHLGNDHQLSIKSLVTTQRAVLAQVRNGEITFEKAFRHFIVEQDYSGLHNLLQHESIGEEHEDIYRLLLSASTAEDGDFANKAYSLLHRILDSGRTNVSLTISTIVSKNLSRSLKTAADDVIALYKKTISSWPGENDISSLETEMAPVEKVAESLQTLSNIYEEFEYLYLNIGQGDSLIGSLLRLSVNRETQQLSRDIARATLLGAFASPRQDFVGIVDQLGDILLLVSLEQIDADDGGEVGYRRATETDSVNKAIGAFRDELRSSHLWSANYSLLANHHRPFDFRMSILEREIVRHQLDNSSLKEEQIFDNTIDEAISLVRKYLNATRKQQALTKAVKVIENAASKGKGIEMTQEVVGVVAEEAGVSAEKIMQDKHDNQKKKLAELSTQQQDGYDEQLKIVTETLINTIEKPMTDRVTRASFLFTGSDQAAKVNIAEMIAKFSPSPMKEVIQIKMDEYHGPHGVYKIIGRPSSDPLHRYVIENHYGGTLADKIRANPQSVILFELGDKIEEDESDDYRGALDILKEIVSEGRLTDSFGNLVSFHDAIVIVALNNAVLTFSESFTQKFDAEISLLLDTSFAL